MSRRRRRALLMVTVVAVTVTAVLLLVPRSSDERYTARAWPYGAVVQVEPAEAAGDDVIEDAARLFERTFSLWGFESPQARSEGRVAREGGVDLYALAWRDAVLSPILLVIFPNAEQAQQATGLETLPATLLYGAPPTMRWGRQPFTVSLAGWVEDLVGSSMSILCAGEGWQEQLVGEASKSLLRQAMENPDVCACTPVAIPEIVEEGFAGYATSRLLGGMEGQIDAARRWAGEHEITTRTDEGLLEFDVDRETLTALGTSFIAYLAQERDDDDMVAAICAWQGSGVYCRESTAQTIRYVRGWRAFLGLPAP